MPTTPISTWSARRLDPAVSNEPQEALEVAVNLKPSTTYLSGTVLGEMIGTDELNTVTVSATGGSWKAIFNAITSAAIPFNATAAVVQSTMEAMSSVGIGNVLVEGAAGGPYAITFRASLGSQNTPNLTTDAALLTGGGTTATVVNTTAGAAGTQGLFAPYASGNSDGSQVPKALLRRSCVTDANGYITFGDGPAGTSEWGQTTRSADVFTQGVFRTEDLVGLDAAAITALGRLISGTRAKGLIQVR